MPGLQPTPGFTAQFNPIAKQSSLTMSINKVSQNTSLLQCSFAFGTGLSAFGSDKIQVLLGRMKQDLPVILKNVIVSIVSYSHLTVDVPTISCKPPSCSSLTNTTAEIPCKVSGTPPPSTKKENWIKINRNRLPAPVDSDRFSIVGEDSSMPLLTISSLNCTLDDGDTYNISSKNILGISQPYHWNISRVFGKYMYNI